MNHDVFKAALAGLLHDVGKFAQRAGETFGIPWRDEENSDIKNEYGYQHALYTDQIIERLVPEPWRQDVRGIAGHHHRPQTHRERVIALADHLSAGERADSGDKQPKQLQSIFCSLTGLTDANGQSIKAPDKKYLPLKKLAIEHDTIFPVDTIDDSHGTYEVLWREFEADAKKLKAAHEGESADLPTYLHSLLNLMQQYTWCIPSAYYQSVPDVSLYDHSRMTAALAACLVGQPEEKVQAWLAKESQDEPVALLVGGDISGVQKFIYTITSQGATGGLRGRSMRNLQLLTEVIARYLLDRLGLPLTNLIYAGGGHFFFLAPADAADKLAEQQKVISRILLHHHGGDLYLALAWEQIQADEFPGDSFRDRWEGLQQALQIVKQRKFAELGDALAGSLFAPQEQGGDDNDFCAVCHREHPTSKIIDKDREDRGSKCAVCAEFEELGKDLRRAKYLCLDQVAPVDEPKAADPPGDYKQVLSHFGYGAYLGEEISQLPPSTDAVYRRTVLTLQDDARDIDFGPKQAVGRQLLVNVTPLLTQDEHTTFESEVDDLNENYDYRTRPLVKPFEVLARQSRGIKRLGVLRMDVDNLGQIMSQGLSGDKYTLSRMATLSFSISLFFEGWVEMIAQQINHKGQQVARGIDEPGDLIYSIYSGGDDLFMVGAWDLMPLLAERISRDLSEYTAQHPAVHVSGGLALIPSKYPLYQAADDAEAAETLAKSLRPDGEAKNALAFLEQVMPWAKFGEVKEWQETLVGLVEPASGQKKVPKSLLQRLLQLYAEYDAFRQQQLAKGETPQVYWGPGQWHSAYTLGRLAERHIRGRTEIKQIRDQLRLENFNNIQWIGLAARWAELITKSDK